MLPPVDTSSYSKMYIRVAEYCRRIMSERINQLDDEIARQPQI